MSLIFNQPVYRSSILGPGPEDIAQAAGARIVITNAEPTQFDDISDVKLSGLLEEDLPRMCIQGRT